MEADWLRTVGVVLGCVFLVNAPPPFGTPSHPRAAQAAAQGLVLRLAADQREYAPGEPVEARVELRNGRGAPITLIVAPGQLFDLVVYDAQGNRVWAWTQSRPAPLVPPERRVMAPGETVSHRLIWDQRILRGPLQPAGRVPPGAYFLEAVLHAPVAEIPRLALRTPRIGIRVRF